MPMPGITASPPGDRRAYYRKADYHPIITVIYFYLSLFANLGHALRNENQNRDRRLRSKWGEQPGQPSPRKKYAAAGRASVARREGFTYLRAIGGRSA